MQSNAAGESDHAIVRRRT